MCILAVNIPDAHNVNISHLLQYDVSLKFVVLSLKTRPAKVGIINISPTLNKILNINNYNLGTRFYKNVMFKNLLENINISDRSAYFKKILAT